MLEHERKAAERIKTAYEIAQGMGHALIVAYSGGKDSDVLLDLAIRAEVPFRAEHNHTTADAPQTVYHIREVFARLEARGIPCKVNRPDISMWGLIAKNTMPPTQIARYCCDELKERRFEGQHLLFGVRWAESRKRSGRGLHEALHRKKEKRIVYRDENADDRRLTEICAAKGQVITNPIIDWYDDDIWRYVRDRRIEMNPLYAMGFHRVGCIGCPYAGKRRLKEFAAFPRYKDMYLRAFARMLETRKDRGKETVWQTPKDVFDWWVDPRHIQGQIEMEF
jgi:phosphoadenosine phosphosulfate reductase